MVEYGDQQSICATCMAKIIDCMKKIQSCSRKNCAPLFGHAFNAIGDSLGRDKRMPNNRNSI